MGLRESNCFKGLLFRRYDVVPLAMEFIPGDGDRVHLLVSDLDSLGYRFPSISQHTLRPVSVVVDPIS
jgi:hypothetical protein